MKTWKYCRKYWTGWGSGRFENAMEINASKSKAVRFTRARVKNPLNYSINGRINTGSEQL